MRLLRLILDQDPLSGKVYDEFLTNEPDLPPGVLAERVFDELKKVNAVVYDSQMGASDTDDPTTALGGGSIVIHCSKPIEVLNEQPTIPAGLRPKAQGCEERATLGEPSKTQNPNGVSSLADHSALSQPPWGCFYCALFPG